MNLATATVLQLLIPVDNLERGLSFYRDVLGLPFLFAAPPQMAFFQCGAVRILIGVTPAGQSVHRGSTIYFGVPDIHAIHSSLLERGVNFKGAPQIAHRTAQSELWLAEFVDPDGNQLALICEVAVPASE